ncbi:MAG: hypothetical protein IJW18_04145 [Lachnospiraceae bacterium]|nr:hypothetical protein [Lachnospiraceae bacterium]
MSAKTKIVVFKMREVIYTAIFAVLGICLITLLIFMFLKGRDNDSSSKNGSSVESFTNLAEAEDPIYIAGVYQSSVVLHNQVIGVEVIVDKHNINSISLIHNDDATITTMFPLFTPTMNELAAQIIEAQSLDGITYSEENKYTSMVLLEAIRHALSKAKIS